MKLYLPILIFTVTILVSCQPEPNDTGADNEMPSATVAVEKNSSNDQVIASQPTDKNVEKIVDEDEPVVSESSQKSQPTKAIKSPNVEKKIKAIEQHLRFIDDKRGEMKVEKLTPNIHSPKDVVGLWRLNGEVLRGTTSFFMGDSEARDYYIFDKGELVYLRHREWHPQAEQPFAKEVIAYFDGDVAIDIKERKVLLQKGEKPNRLMQAQIHQSEMAPDSLANVVNSVWSDVKKKAKIK